MAGIIVACNKMQKDIEKYIALQRYLCKLILEINNKVCHNTRQPSKKEAGHVISYKMRRTPLLGSKI